MGSLRNIFACLVHENQDCVIDLVRNLRALDPASLILLYDGGRDPKLLNDQFPFERYGAVVHPSPRPAEWGHLHQFALDCMDWARENHSFDTLTIVDSDQLATRPGYSEYLGEYLRTQPRAGLLCNSPAVQVPGTRIFPAEAALREIELWRPFLREFPRGEEKFVHWCFWPSTVFTAEASRELSELFATNRRLQEIMRQTRIWASEEVILPTLVALLGYEIRASPCNYDFVQYRVAFTLSQIELALSRREVFWVHPVPRRYDDPLRTRIRERWNHYRCVRTDMAAEVPLNLQAETAPRLLLTIPILERMRVVEGWLDEAEADLLIAAVTRAVADVSNGAVVVEIGSYCGRSTVVLASALNGLQRSEATRIFAIDAHDGVVGALDQGMKQMGPTAERFRRNIANAGLAHLVEPIMKHPIEVEWNRPICFLLIDGLHDYANVARDFYHFEPWMEAGGLIAFHDYADYYPGVKVFVDELLAHGLYEEVARVQSMIVLRGKREARGVTELPPATDSAPAAAPAPALISNAPMVSCIMPTADRRAFVSQAISYFLRQDYTRRELIILDDGVQEIADLIPSDSRIRYMRMDRKRTMGAKHNMACEMARGDVIVHWDDDDWMADWRLSYQVKSLMSEPIDTLSGLSRLFFYDPQGPNAWEYIYPASERPWVSGGTFCYQREFWERRRFPDLNEGADTVFVWGLQDAKVMRLDRSDFYVAVVHAHNTSPKRTSGFGWHPLPPERIRSMLGGDLSFYESSNARLISMPQSVR